MWGPDDHYNTDMDIHIHDKNASCDGQQVLGAKIAWRVKNSRPQPKFSHRTLCACKKLLTPKNIT